MPADLRLALRTLRRSPGFALATALTLALGLGATTALFTAVRGVLLRPLPYPRPEQLVQLWEVGSDGHTAALADPNFDDLRRGTRALGALAEYQATRPAVVGGGDAALVTEGVVSRLFFAVMGVRPTVGRAFLPEEQRRGAHTVIVGDAFWRRRLGASGDLGRLTLTLDGTPYQVVGVMPPGFAFPDGAELWTSREAEAEQIPSRTAHNWKVVARLRDGVAPAAAQRELTRLARGIKQQYGSDVDLTDARIVPLRDQLVGRTRPALLLLLGGAVVLLLASAANVGTLLLVRAEARRREFGVRAAVGATGARLVAQVLAEVGALAAAGGALGVAAAWAGARALGALAPDAPLAGALARPEAVRVDGAVLAFAAAVAGAVTLALGLAAGWRAASAGARAALGTERAGTTGRAGTRTRSTLVAAQVALTATLLVTAGLLARSLVRLTSVDPGFRAAGAVAVRFSAPWPDDADSAGMRRRHDADEAVVGRLRALPGVRAAGGVSSLPVWGGNGGDGTFVVQRRVDEVKTLDDFKRLADDPSRAGSASYRKATDGYVEAMGIPLLRGRTFRPSDGPDDAPVALISAAVARTRFAGQEPLGQLVQFGNMDGDLRPMTVVGVVGDVREFGLDGAPEPTVYALARQRPGGGGLTVVLAGGRDGAPPVDLAATAAAARRAVRAVDATLPVRVRSMEDVFAGAVATRRYGLVVAAAFAGAALALAATGLYGVVAYLAAERRRELGVRVALGARAGDLRRLVLVRGLAPAALGVGAGLAAALAASRLLAAQLYEVRAADPVTYLAVAALLLGVAAGASWGPARRAGKTDPLEALRAE